MRLHSISFALLALSTACYAQGENRGNRLTYLDGSDPYYVGLDHPKLVTPQWVGEAGVEAVVTLAIDDMNKPSPWVPFLKPVIARLKEIYAGRAPLSIMTTKINPQLDDWPPLLASGITIECHTFDHPCPILCRRDFAAAKSTFDRCIEVMSSVPGNQPVAFRVPCCDSLNTPSPRFYAEIFNKTTPKGRFLAIDSSVFNVLTPDDPALPRGLVVDPDGRERFRKYLPFESFVNTIDNYPYPYVIGGLCWEFPCVTPSDWSAQHLNRPRSPRSFADLKAALDAVVLKQGTYNLVFHPYGWSHFNQIVELIDHGFTNHGKKLLFLSFKDCLMRMNEHLLAGQSLRAKTGGDNGVRLLDLNDDGYLDVVIGNDELRITRTWSPEERRWIDGELPVQLVRRGESGVPIPEGVRFGVVGGRCTMLVRNETSAGAWQFDGGKWVPALELLEGLEIDEHPVLTSSGSRDLGVRFRDIDMDGQCELIVGNPDQGAVFAWRDGTRRWTRMSFALPALTRIVDSQGRDAGLRFVDIDEDGYQDVIFSNEQRYSLHLYRSSGEGWSKEVLSDTRDAANPLPMISRSGTDNGVFFHSRHMWVQNEDTAHLRNLVDRRSFNQLLASVEPVAKTPEASRRSIRVHPGFRVELVAAEPFVRDPVAIAFGEDGLLWVVEMGGYPNGPGGNAGGGEPGGRVRWLEDTDDDGAYDRSTVFADGLAFPTGVQPWRDGVLVTCAPDILYIADTDGDGVGDRRLVLYRGFRKGNPQHRVNGLRWGLDNWIHCANGDSGGLIESLKTGVTVDIRGRDFRIRPGDGRIDLQTGMTQFGRCRDDWGNWFGGNSGRTLWHCVLRDHYLRRNPHFAPPNPRVDVMTPAAFAPVFPISRTLPRFNDLHTSNRFTSACGACIYRDELLGPHFVDSYFLCEPVHNLVHCGRMTAKGVSFVGRRLAGGDAVEFLASSDNWFRPVQVRTGPDGAIWVVDMYRSVIEHPRWIPKDWQDRLDLRAGHQRGRIYRVLPVTAKSRSLDYLRRNDTDVLVEALSSPNGPRRDIAQQRLVELGARVGKRGLAGLEKIAATDPRARCRLQALCTLDGLGAATPAVLLRGLEDPHASVRRHAVRISEAQLAGNPDLQGACLNLVADPDPQVRLQLASSLGAWQDRRAAQALATIAKWDAGDPYLVAAVMSSASKHLGTLLAEVGQALRPAAGIQGQSTKLALLKQLVVLSVGAGDVPAMVCALKMLGAARDGRHHPWQFQILAELLDALGRRDRSLATLRADADVELRAAIDALVGVFKSARRSAVSEAAPRSSRVQAIRLLSRGLAGHDTDIGVLSRLLEPQSPGEFQLAAAAALGKLGRAEVPALLLDGWQGHGPGLRSKILDIVLERPVWTEQLLDRIEAPGDTRILPASLSIRHRQHLTRHPAKSVRTRAVGLLARAPDPDRQKVLLEAGAALTLTGDRTRGELLFRQQCSICHRLGGLGYNVGPDLRVLTDRTPKALLDAILDPNQAVESRYISYTAQTTDGRMFAGILTDETGNSVTLVGPVGTRQVFLRNELKQLKASGWSLMPTGYENLLRPQDLADVIAYVGQSHPPRKHFKGNTPAVVRPKKNGAILLTATVAELYGPKLYYYTRQRVLGDWQRPEDRAVWSLDVPSGGRYDVYMEWACTEQTAGNRYLVEVNTGSIGGEVIGTGKAWGKYRRVKIGQLELAPGLQSLVMHSDGPIKVHALLDLRLIELVPVEK